MRTYSEPDRVPDGWDTGHDERFAGLSGPLQDGTYTNLHSVLVAVDGRLVFEWYGNGRYEDGLYHLFDRTKLHSQHSVTKSVTSALIGIAIDRGLIGGVGDKLSTYFPAEVPPDKDALTVHHLLSMTTGLEWDEQTYPYTDARNDHVSMNRSGDPVRYVFALPLVAEPGTTFRYNSGVTIALGELLHRATGTKADAFAAEHLFAPLGITKRDWWKYPNGVVQTGGGLHLRPRDMAKVGQLFLDGGRDVVSASWVRESTRKQAPDFDYGYQWWLGSHEGVGLYSAQGRGGQAIVVAPSLGMVVVFTAWNDDAKSGQWGDLLTRHVLPTGSKS